MKNESNELEKQVVLVGYGLILNSCVWPPAP